MLIWILPDPDAAGGPAGEPLDSEKSILDLTGRSPLVRAGRIGAPPGALLRARPEGLNPMGGVRGRFALAIVEQAERPGRLRPGMALQESTPGDTGIGPAMVGAVQGDPVKVVMPALASVERRGERQRIIALLRDRGERDLSTDLFNGP